MTFIDICAGIGGFRLGFEQAGFKCIGFAERDKFARQSYMAMYDTTGEWTSGDVEELNSRDIPDTDIWTFGFPCQDISIAGKQNGLHGKKSGLFFKIIRLLKEKENKPEWIVCENVKNLLSIHDGWGFAEVLSEMDEGGVRCRVASAQQQRFRSTAKSRTRVYCRTS